MPDDPASPSLALQLARWFDARLTECPPQPSSNVRLYGLEVIDRSGIHELSPTAVRSVFIEEGPDRASVVTASGVMWAGRCDALAVVLHRWLPRPTGPARPGLYPRRRRARVVRVFADTSAVAIRFDDEPDAVVFSTAA